MGERSDEGGRVESVNGFPAELGGEEGVVGLVGTSYEVWEPGLFGLELFESERRRDELESDDSDREADELESDDSDREADELESDDSDREAESGVGGDLESTVMSIVECL
jgi:hypothetical protein